MCSPILKYCSYEKAYVGPAASVRYTWPVCQKGCTSVCPYLEFIMFAYSESLATQLLIKLLSTLALCISGGRRYKIADVCGT